MTKNKQEIFRKKSIQRLSSPDQLDQPMKITSLKEWLTLAALGSVALVGVLWSIFGRIPVTVTGKGMLVFTYIAY